MFCGSEEEFHLSIEEGSMGMGLVCQDLKIVGVNKTICDMVGYSKEELVGKTFADLTFQDDLNQEIELAEKLFKGEIPLYTIKKRLITHQGELLWVNLFATKFCFYKEETPSLSLGIIEDISTRVNNFQEAVIEEVQDHARRTAEMVVDLSRKMNLNEEEITQIFQGALLHDIGKLALPTGIVRKKGPLSEEEWKIIRQHPVNAYQMLAPIEHLKGSLDIPLYHHEKWDGTGYPRGLRGSQIPFSARIFSVVDVWDALISDRTYRQPWRKADALLYIQDQSGKGFDPHIVDIFLKMLEGK